MNYTYILYSHSTGKFYKGQSNDVFIRLKRHNSCRERATKSGVPWVLVWYVLKKTRSESYQLEQKLKNLSKERVVKFCLKYKEGIPGADEMQLLQHLSAC